MTKIAFDTNALIYLFGFGEDPALAGSGNKARKQWMGALHNARDASVSLIVPTPSLAEFFGCKRVNEDQCQLMEENLRNYFSFVPFTHRTADILARSWRDNHPANHTRDRLARNEIQFDQMVASIALENNATHLVTHDKRLRKQVESSGHSLAVWSLDDLADHFKGPQADLFAFHEAPPSAPPAKPKRKKR